MAKQPRIIKASQLAGTQPAPFNTADTLAELEQRLARAGAEVRDVQESARQEMERLREAARSEGFATGRQEGLAQGRSEAQANHRAELEAELTRHLETLHRQLEHLANSLVLAREEWLAQWQHLGLEVACRIAERLVRGHLAQPNDVARKTLAEVLALVGRCPKVSVTVSPIDAETLRLDQSQWLASTRAVGEIELRTDPAMSPGGIRFESEFGTIDATIETQLERIRHELLGSDPSAD